MVPPTTTDTTPIRKAHRTTSTALKRAMARRHGPLPAGVPVGVSVGVSATYGEIFFGFVPMPKVFGSADVNSSTDGLNCEHSPYWSQAIGPLMPSNLMENTASRSAFLPIYRLPALSLLATFSIALMVSIAPS